MERTDTTNTPTLSTEIFVSVSGLLTWEQSELTGLRRNATGSNRGKLLTPVTLMNQLIKSLNLTFRKPYKSMLWVCRSQRPRGLRRRSAAARLLRLWVRIPPGGMDVWSVVSVVCCQVEVSATN